VSAAKIIIFWKRMNIFYDYLHNTTYYNCGGAVEGSKEEGEVPGVYKADMRCTWAMGWATSISKAYGKYMECTYMNQSLHGL